MPQTTTAHSPKPSGERIRNDARHRPLRTLTLLVVADGDLEPIHAEIRIHTSKLNELAARALHTRTGRAYAGPVMLRILP